MKAVVKRAVELGLCRSGLVRLARHFHRNDVLVLAYHNVVPQDANICGETSLHISQDRFHRQISTLLKTHQFIAIEQIHDPGSGTRPRAVVTFDDAYRGAVRLGVDVLRELNVPATIFVAPSWLGGQAFWWDLLAKARKLTPEVRDFALARLQGAAAPILNWASIPSYHADLPGYCLTASEADLDLALGFDGISLGSHSWSHPNLATLAQDELDEELRKPMEWLRERYMRRAAGWLSYPYGRWSNDVVQAVRGSGYEGAFRIEGGWIPKGCDPFTMPRLNVPSGISTEGLELRCSGL